MPEEIPEHDVSQDSDAPPAFSSVVNNMDVRQYNLNSSIRVSGVCGHFLIFYHKLPGRISGTLFDLLINAKATGE